MHKKGFSGDSTTELPTIRHRPDLSNTSPPPPPDPLRVPPAIKGEWWPSLPGEVSLFRRLLNWLNKIGLT